jgi:hypothetical protein
MGVARCPQSLAKRAVFGQDYLGVLGNRGGLHRNFGLARVYRNAPRGRSSTGCC